MGKSRKSRKATRKEITKETVKDIKKEISPYKTGFFVSIMLTALIMLVFIGAAVFVKDPLLAIGTITGVLFISYFILATQLFELMKENKRLEEEMGQ